MKVCGDARGFLISEVARIAGATVDVGVGLIHMVGIIGCALAAPQTGAALEHF